MSKYNDYWNEKVNIHQKKGAHPIWMGIGFLMIIIIPVISWAGSLIILEQDFKYGWVPITGDMLAKFNGVDPYLYIKIGLTVFISLTLFVILFFVYFSIYRIFGPPRYGSQDVPLERYKVKKYKR